ncbi:MAG: hypothetical protein N5P05_003659 [Chroococcopsis gigantea SAG 12.99]|nr:hypothetical protein [Chroococcopsis gigantea SAG 12.99]
MYLPPTSPKNPSVNLCKHSRKKTVERGKKYTDRAVMSRNEWEVFGKITDRSILHQWEI